MEKNIFLKERADEKHQNWENIICRKNPLYPRDNDIRTEFERDYTRILHSLGYRRLKHKTQVFFAPKNDHICTRIEHVNHVASVSSTICKYLGLNEQLANAISLGHDIGHAPFGHHGEICINDIYEKYLPEEKFWHEKNSLIFVDNIETLQDPTGYENPLDLTYAVRDGIICHCGEVDENGLKPRSEKTDLYSISEVSQVSPYTWEACVVKIADRIAYLGRDIEDAIQYNIIDMKSFRELKKLLQDTLGDISVKTVNTTVLINNLIVNLCTNSSLEKGFCFSTEYYNFLKEIKEFNKNHIYGYWKIEAFKKYATLIINTIFEVLRRIDPIKTKKKHTLDFNLKNFPDLYITFKEWLIKYTNFDEKAKKEKK